MVENTINTKPGDTEFALKRNYRRLESIEMSITHREVEHRAGFGLSYFGSQTNDGSDNLAQPIIYTTNIIPV